MKKMLSVLFVVSIVCSIFVFSGCKNNKTDVASDTTTELMENTQMQADNGSDNGNSETWEVYEYEDGTYYINGYNGTDKIVQVPSEINGIKVSGLTGRSFNMNTLIEEVYLPETVITISSNAFYECKNLKKISLPNTLQYIGEMAFAYCESLTEVVLPRDLEYIGVNAFAMCTSLVSVTFNCEKLKTLEKKCFSCTALETVKIPSCVTTIKDSFFECVNLKEAYIPDSVTEMNSTFNRSPNVVIYGTPGSCAENYAKDKNYEFVAQ